LNIRVEKSGNFISVSTTVEFSRDLISVYNKYYPAANSTANNMYGFTDFPQGRVRFI